MLPLLLSVAGTPLVKTPNPPPEIEPPELFVMLPPPARSTPAPLALAALMMPLLVTVPAPSRPDIDTNTAAPDRCARTVGDAAAFGEFDAAVFHTRNAAAVRYGARGSGNEDAE